MPAAAGGAGLQQRGRCRPRSLAGAPARACRLLQGPEAAAAAAQARAVRDTVCEWCSRRGPCRAAVAMHIAREVVAALCLRTAPYDHALGGVDWCAAGYAELLSPRRSAAPAAAGGGPRAGPPPPEGEAPARRARRLPPLARCTAWYDLAPLLWGCRTSRSVVHLDPDAVAAGGASGVLSVWSAAFGLLDERRQRRRAAALLALWWARRYGLQRHGALLRRCIAHLAPERGARPTSALQTPLFGRRAAVRGPPVLQPCRASGTAR
eukprot:TRINITY_DN61825_c0_g1_i1.p2 TRINITY_DN61825_c0_g1~~TRINITY_DN61825_c0_g1_i1.p2  ORF type:complete len:265 (+),score=43.57 TRINITY_DN61825_c0_g1_i1:76-870(+)